MNFSARCDELVKTKALLAQTEVHGVKSLPSSFRFHFIFSWILFSTDASISSCNYPRELQFAIDVVGGLHFR